MRVRHGTDAVIANIAVMVVIAVAVLGALATAGAGPTQATGTPAGGSQFLTSSLSSGVTVAEEPLLSPDICLPDTTSPSLDTLFSSSPTGIVGADYPRTLPLPSGEVLWTFQDAKILRPGGGYDVLHNIGMVQRDNCFTLLRGGTPGAPRPWLFPYETVDFVRWFWPLDAEVGSDGRVYVWLADMREFLPPPPPAPPPAPGRPAPPPEPTLGYLVRTVPQGTYVARIDPATWNVEWYGRPVESGTDLYGFAIESDRKYTYLFAQCHRQFGFDPYIFGVLAHDRSCTDRVTVSRVPRGRLFDVATYWDGQRWTTDRHAAVPIIEQTDRFANPTQFLFRNNHWMAITKIDDWWGSDVVVEQARRVFGPYEEVFRFRPGTKCGDDCNTYFASWTEGQTVDDPAAALTFSVSHNRWDGTATSIYRPTFYDLLPPPDLRPLADRCSAGHC